MSKTTLNLDEAKTHLSPLSRLADRAASGEDVTIARSGKPVARLTRLQPPKGSIRFGVLKGKVRMSGPVLTSVQTLG